MNGRLGMLIVFALGARVVRVSGKVRCETSNGKKGRWVQFVSNLRGRIGAFMHSLDTPILINLLVTITTGMHHG
jgi:hypothetical protein